MVLLLLGLLEVLFGKFLEVHLRKTLSALVDESSKTEAHHVKDDPDEQTAARAHRDVVPPTQLTLRAARTREHERMHTSVVLAADLPW